MDQTAVYDLFHSMFDMLSFVLAGAYAVAIVAGFAAFMAKQNQAMRSRDRADFLAHYDPTSGVLNRSGFTSEAKRLLGQNADPYADVATICVDIDRFKELNDTFGYRSRGGGCLPSACRQGAQCRRRSGRRRGTSGRGRIRRDRALSLARRRRIAGPQAADGDRAAVPLSGQDLPRQVQHRHPFRRQPMPLETRLHKAEQALSQAKYDAGNCLRVFSEPLEHQMVRRRYLEELVATGLAENRFWVAFQPLVEPATGCCAGFEALLRLDCPRWAARRAGRVHPCRGAHRSDQRDRRLGARTGCRKCTVLARFIVRRGQSVGAPVRERSARFPGSRSFAENRPAGIASRA